MNNSEVLTFEEYAARHGASRAEYGDHGLLNPAGNVPQSTRARQIRWQAAKDQRLAERREQLRLEYDQKVAAGEIRPPTRLEQLQAAAAGHPDRPSTQAARRILDRMNPEGSQHPIQNTRDDGNAA